MSNASRPCSVAGCPHLQPCPVHARGRGSTDERPSASARGYDRRWRKLRLMYLRAHPLCVRCMGAATIADHVIPRSAGGTDTWDNLQSMCWSCHNVKIGEEKRQASSLETGGAVVRM